MLVFSGQSIITIAHMHRPIYIAAQRSSLSVQEQLSAESFRGTPDQFVAADNEQFGQKVFSENRQVKHYCVS